MIEKCIVCHNEEIIRSFGHMKQCKNCFFTWMPDPESKFDLIKSIYDGKYFKNWKYGYVDYEMSRDQFYNTFKKRLQQFVPLFSHKNKVKLLDIGCGTGILLDMVTTEFGWEAYGVDPFPISPEIRGKYGDRVKQAFFSKELFLDKFDIITCYDVLEHCPNPLFFFDMLVEYCKQGTILHIATPNINSFSAIIFKKKWMHYKDEHITFFGDKTISLLFNKFNFIFKKKEKAIRCLTPSYLFNRIRCYYPIVSFLAKPFKKNKKKFYLSFTGEMLITGEKK